MLGLFNLHLLNFPGQVLVVTEWQHRYDLAGLGIPNGNEAAIIKLAVEEQVLSV